MLRAISTASTTKNHCFVELLNGASCLLTLTVVYGIELVLLPAEQRQCLRLARPTCAHQTTQPNGEKSNAGPQLSALPHIFLTFRNSIARDHARAKASVLVSRSTSRVCVLLTTCVLVTCPTLQRHRGARQQGPALEVLSLDQQPLSRVRYLDKYPLGVAP